MDIYSALKIIVDGSAQLNSWALGLAAASVIAIVGTDYLHPSKRWRLIYLLFAPAWAFSGLSVYFGNQVSRRYMAAVMGEKENVSKIASYINSDFALQQTMLEVALIFFGLWLALFLAWWIFFATEASHRRSP
jgi:MFS family permease